jgi:hypothetical protein
MTHRNSALLSLSLSALAFLMPATTLAGTQASLKISSYQHRHTVLGRFSLQMERVAQALIKRQRKQAVSQLVLQISVRTP